MSQVDGTLLRLLQARYGQASRKEKGHLLGAFVKTTGCHQKHAIRMRWPAGQDLRARLALLCNLAYNRDTGATHQLARRTESVLRKTVAVAGLIVIVAALLLVVESRMPGAQVSVFASRLPAAGAYLPYVSRGSPLSPPPTPDPICSPCYPDVCIPPAPPDLDCGEIAFC